MSDSKYQQLVAHLSEAHHLERAVAILQWDQQVKMPTGGAPQRAAQLAVLSRIAHEAFAQDKTARLLEDAEREIDGMDYDSDEASMVRVAKEDYRLASKLPAEFVAELTRATSLGRGAWIEARATNTFRTFEPQLQHIIDLTLQRAEYLGYNEHPYDALIDEYERGITTAQVAEIFGAHKPALVGLIAAVQENSDAVDDSLVHQQFDIEKQKQFALDVIKAYGFDFERGRQDVSVHPFCTHFSRGDVRITTRFHDDFLNPALFGMMHEAGHGMYEQGSPERFEGTPLSGGTSLGVHESQSRLWENVVGRSKGFWIWALPKLQAYFPDELGSADVDSFYKAINKVGKSFIRVESDESTYNLHIMLRFELETDMVSGKVKVRDLPEEWNDRFESFFGITPPTDTLGVLQDIHWSMGLVGYFATYALGNLLSVQYYNKAVQQHPGIPDEITSGKFDTLRNWMQDNIYQHGRKFTSDELTRRVTGESIQSRDYMQYLQTKFGDIYGL